MAADDLDDDAVENRGPGARRAGSPRQPDEWRGPSRRCSWPPPNRSSPRCWPSSSSGRWPRWRGSAPSWPPSAPGGGSSWPRWPAATGSRPILISPPTSSATSSRASHARLSGAALETLAVIAYKQPVTRSQLSAVRGVDVDGVVRSLLDRGYIEEVGRTEGVGHPIQYGTTRLFLERLGLESLEKLPALADLVPDPAVIGRARDPPGRGRPARRPLRPGPPPAADAVRPGEGQATLGDIDPAWDAPAD